MTALEFRKNPGTKGINGDSVRTPAGVNRDAEGELVLRIRSRRRRLPALGTPDLSRTGGLCSVSGVARYQILTHPPGGAADGRGAAHVARSRAVACSDPITGRELITGENLNCTRSGDRVMDF
ncbi:hypothetical protein GCM10010442_26800 [Kitasatospora kifunensis]